MRRFDLVEVEARVRSVIREDMFCVVLPNGHALPARVGSEARSVSVLAETSSLIGHSVVVRLRTFDLCSGEIVRVCPSVSGEFEG